MPAELTKFEQEMLAYLQSPASSTANARRIFKRTSPKFVLDYGWFYTPSPLSKRLGLGPEGECYNNALKLVLDNPKLTYVEGYAAGGGSAPLRHAWATDGKGRVIDNTWPLSCSVYVGVPFKAGWVSFTGLKRKGVGSLIDDWENDWPLLRELGDEPGKWLKLKGKGFRKVTDTNRS